MKKIIITLMFLILLILGCDEDSPTAPTDDNKVYYNGGPNKDSRGSYYTTVKIGNQVWLKENLNIGTMMSNSNNNQTDNGEIEKYCYNNDEANCDKYGGLYQWDEAMKYVTTIGAQGICPDGWHIPEHVLLDSLHNAVNGSANALKSGSNNSSGFSALLSGYSYRDGSGFDALNEFTSFWNSTQIGGYPTRISLYINDDSIYFTNAHKTAGFSVRCLKN